MVDCIELQAEIEVCEQEADELYDAWNDKETECMDLWALYWTECTGALTETETRRSKRARLFIEGLRKRGYEIRKAE